MQRAFRPRGVCHVADDLRHVSICVASVFLYSVDGSDGAGVINGGVWRDGSFQGASLNVLFMLRSVGHS